MSNRRFLVMMAIAAALAGCTTPKERHLQDGYRLLSAEEIRALHQNQTHEVELASGKSAVAFFTADGRSTFRRSDGVADQGGWEVRGQNICYVYPSIPATSHNCFSVAVKDGNYVLFKEYFDTKGDFGAQVINIIPGNVQGLPLD
ncbi:MAG TPA: hypothetical protein EYP07_12345 [Kiloniellaceae bacterium]|nr:hypothetical protein [Kiloniellaceae bacterium]